MKYLQKGVIVVHNAFAEKIKNITISTMKKRNAEQQKSRVIWKWNVTVWNHENSTKQVTLYKCNST